MTLLSALIQWPTQTFTQTFTVNSSAGPDLHGSFTVERLAELRLWFLAETRNSAVPRYQFTLGDSPMRATVEILSDDAAAKRYACIVVDEINRNVTSPSRVLVWDNDGELLAAVRPMEE